MTQIKSVCVKAVPDSTKLRLVKVKNFQGSMHPDPHSLPHALHTDTYLPPKKSIQYHFAFPPPPPPPPTKIVWMTACFPRSMLVRSWSKIARIG